MQTMVKYAAAATLAGALALSMATPSQARHGHNAATIGFAAGAVVGAAVAGANNGYDYGPGYYYEPGYAYAPDAYGAYAYEPAPVYGVPYRDSGALPACAADGPYDRPDLYAC